MPPSVFVQRFRDGFQFCRRQLTTGDQIERALVVPGYDRRTSAVDVVWRTLRTHLVDSCRSARYSSLARTVAVFDIERQPAGFLLSRVRLTDDECAVVGFKRAASVLDFSKLVVANVDAERLQLTAGGVARNPGLKTNERTGVLP